MTKMLDYEAILIKAPLKEEFFEDCRFKDKSTQTRPIEYLLKNVVNNRMKEIASEIIWNQIKSKTNMTKLREMEWENSALKEMLAIMSVWLQDKEIEDGCESEEDDDIADEDSKPNCLFSSPPIPAEHPSESLPTIDDSVAPMEIQELPGIKKSPFDSNISASTPSVIEVEPTLKRKLFDDSGHGNQEMPELSFHPSNSRFIRSTSTSTYEYMPALPATMVCSTSTPPKLYRHSQAPDESRSEMTRSSLPMACSSRPMACSSLPIACSSLSSQNQCTTSYVTPGPVYSTSIADSNRTQLGNSLYANSYHSQFGNSYSTQYASSLRPQYHNTRPSQNINTYPPRLANPYHPQTANTYHQQLVNPHIQRNAPSTYRSQCMNRGQLPPNPETYRLPYGKPQPPPYSNMYRSQLMNLHVSACIESSSSQFVDLRHIRPSLPYDFQSTNPHYPPKEPRFPFSDNQMFHRLPSMQFRENARGLATLQTF